MGIVYLLFIILTGSVLFSVLVWAVVTGYRILFPEQPHLTDQQADLQLWHEEAHRVWHVGVREIQAAQERQQADRHQVPYHYVQGLSDGFPSSWADDLWTRRN